MVDDVGPPTDTDDEVLEDARLKFQRCKERESQARQNGDDDERFVEGDNFNNWQWDSALVQSRQLDRRPVMTVNMTRQKVLQLLNDARQNKPGIEIRAIGDGATYEAAKIFEGIVRHIEYVSLAQAAYDTATNYQLKRGMGYWRVLTRYVTDLPSQSAFDQEIIIQRIPDPRSVYLDGSIQLFDGSDAKYAFVFRDWPRKEYETAHPDLSDELSSTTLDASHDWVSEDTVREAEFYRRVEKTEWLIERMDGSVAREKELDPDEVKQLKGLKTQRRKVVKPEIQWYKILGNKVIDRKIWPGIYIPIVRVVGEETLIEGRLDWKGHVRAQRDSQMFYNYCTSATAEYIGLQSKTPYVAQAGAVEGLETYYENANTANFAWLPYNAFDDQGRPMERPSREPAPQAPQAYLTSMQLADQQLMKVTGQYEANLGAPSNETSGVAIQQRQRKGDNATYHYIDHLGQAIRFTGRILIDLIPKVYDQPRIVQIMGADGSQKSVQLDPNAIDPQTGQAIAHQQIQDEEDPDYDPKAIAAVLNPTVGRYEVEADVGPSFATRRQDEFNSLSQIMQQNQEAMKIAGDLLFRAADFPGADTLAERWRRSIDPHLLGADGPPPAVVQMQQQFHEQQTQLQQHGVEQAGEIAKLQTALQDAQRQIKDKGKESSLDEYRAETDRLKVVAATDPAMAQMIFRQLYEQMMDGASIVPMLAHHAQVEQTVNPPQQNQVDPAAADQQAQSQQTTANQQGMAAAAQDHSQQMDQAKLALQAQQQGHEQNMDLMQHQLAVQQANQPPQPAPS